MLHKGLRKVSQIVYNIVYLENKSELSRLLKLIMRSLIWKILTIPSGNENVKQKSVCALLLGEHSNITTWQAYSDHYLQYFSLQVATRN